MLERAKQNNRLENLFLKIEWVIWKGEHVQKFKLYKRDKKLISITEIVSFSKQNEKTTRTVTI